MKCFALLSPSLVGKYLIELITGRDPQILRGVERGLTAADRNYGKSNHRSGVRVESCSLRICFDFFPFYSRGQTLPIWIERSSSQAKRKALSNHQSTCQSQTQSYDISINLYILLVISWRSTGFNWEESAPDLGAIYSYLIVIFHDRGSTKLYSV